MKAKSYCGKRYGFPGYALGFLIGGLGGYFVSEIIYGQFHFNLALAIVFGLISSRSFVSFLILNRKRQFAEGFCDYLDSISSSLSCGKNTYESFLAANEDIRDFYKEDSPIYVESTYVADGLKSGRRIDELLLEMADRSENEDVRIFCDVYSICNNVGGNLKKIVSDTKSTIGEKTAIETEIRTVLAEPKNELRIMAVMPLAITIALKAFGNQFTGEDSFVINTIALIIFVVAYSLGTKIVNIKVSEIQSDYATVLTKMSLLVNAGLTASDAFERVAYSGEALLYMEMRKAVNDIANGIPIDEALNGLADRCACKEVKKFVSLYKQNLSKGGPEFPSLLSQMAEAAWIDKKNRARLAGSLASQKLLLPLMLMFSGVILIVIVPAFNSLL